jgi:hypothetical protein
MVGEVGCVQTSVDGSACAEGRAEAVSLATMTTIVVVAAVVWALRTLRPEWKEERALLRKAHECLVQVPHRPVAEEEEEEEPSDGEEVETTDRLVVRPASPRRIVSSTPPRVAVDPAPSPTQSVLSSPDESDSSGARAS